MASVKKGSKPATREERTMSIQQGVETVTPEIAEQWLEMNTKNRSLSTQRVERLAAQMRQGLWVFDGSPIRFDETGALVDGQHRLWALIEAQHTAEFLVVRGVSAAAMATMDTGKTRSFADVLSLHDKTLTDVIKLAAVTLIVYRWEQGQRGLAMISGGRSPVPYALLLEFFNQNRAALIEAAREGYRLASRPGIVGSVGGLMWWVFSRIDRDDAGFFFDRLVDGLELYDGSPILALRNWALRERDTRPRMSNDMVAALAFKAWNGFRDGTPVRLLVWRRGGATPEAFPEPH